MSSVELARILIDELIRAGVREAVLSPGSRNAPLAYALRDADEAGRLRLHVRIDERTGAFLALGLAKASGRCVPVVCTSGTAVANLHPAMLEAAHSDIPLLALTADRPLELLGSGANQTTDQARLFGPAARWSATLADGMAPGAIRSAVDRAVAWALGSLSGDPGPAHLNLALREPLVPTGREAAGDTGARAEGPWTALPTARAGIGAGEAIELTPRTVVIAGDGPPGIGARAAQFAAAHGLPIISEPSSGAWGDAIAHAPLLLTAPWLQRRRPDQAIVIGRPTLSRPVRQILAAPDVRTVGIAHSPRWVDASLALSAVHPEASLAVSPAGNAPPAQWLAQWRAAASVAGQVLAVAALEQQPGERMSSPAVARALAAAVPAGALLTLGSSSAVRDVELYAQPRGDLLVLANRGLAGIDGTISSAIGAALALPDRPAFALMGDLTFLHDSNGLILGPQEPRPDLAIVVVNDDGGGIFATLEQGAPEQAASFERVFGTPHGVDLRALCAASGTGHTAVASLGELEAALAEPTTGIRVIEVRTDRVRIRDQHAALSAAVAIALDAL
ncbi:MAG: menD [Jatrophihabitantaceae bacterium]|nr:menD [Jatrophihabitantaceae bacterium]